VPFRQKGFFECASLRFANASFAQNDSAQVPSAFSRKYFVVPKYSCHSERAEGGRGTCCLRAAPQLALAIITTLSS
jgi:hypothetical protein